MAGSEHRENDRIYSHLRCWCEGENVTLYARVGNLSEGGLFLRTSTPFPLGARATLRFGVGGADEFEVKATVEWTCVEPDDGPAGMGLSFDDVDVARLERLRGLVFRERRPADGGN